MPLPFVKAVHDVQKEDDDDDDVEDGPNSKAMRG